MARLVIVYHDPGDESGHGLVDSLLSRACEGLGLECSKVVISAVEEGRADFRQGDLVYALFLGRGGHFETVREAVEAAGAVLLGSIPPRIVAEALKTRLEGCNSVDLAYWPAKRFVERHLSDLEEARRILEESLGVPVSLKTKCEGCNAECIVGYTLMPGKLSKRVESMEAKVKIPFLLPLLEDALATHIKSLAAEALKAEQVGEAARR